MNLKSVLMTLGNRLVQERRFTPAAGLRDVPPEPNTLPISLFTQWINSSTDVQEILADMGIRWPMTANDLKAIDLYDAFDKKINAGDTLDVQKAGHHKVYEIAGELVFCPYGKPELVRSYFRNDLHKVE